MINAAVELLRKRFNPEKIILFGSRATGKAEKDSDYDFLVVARTRIPPEKRFVEARKTLGELPASFDLIIRTPAEYRRERAYLNHIVYFAHKYGRTVYENQ
jgi:predicted nucleotidyltransferase